MYTDLCLHFVAAKEKTHWKRHCHNRVSRARSKAIQSQEHPLTLSACLRGCSSAQPVLWKCLLQVSQIVFFSCNKIPSAIGQNGAFVIYNQGFLDRCILHQLVFSLWQQQYSTLYDTVLPMWTSVVIGQKDNSTESSLTKSTRAVTN